MEYRSGMILRGVSFYLQDKKRLIVKTITKKINMEKTKNKGGWDRVESNIEKLPPFAAPIVRKYMPQYKAASDKAYEAASALCVKLTDTIVKVSKGLIDRKTARAMVLGKPDRLIAICEKFA